VSSWVPGTRDYTAARRTAVRLPGTGGDTRLRASMSRHFRDTTNEEQRATWLELFFDLVYVFAVTQLSHAILADHSPRGLLRAGFLLLVVWWAWIYTTWMANWFDPDSVPVRLVLIAVMLASLMMAVAVPRAFVGDGLLFAAAYVALQVGRNAFNVIVTEHDSPYHESFRRFLAWSLVSAPLWLAGGFADGDARVVLWIAALTIDYVAPLVRYWTPRLGASDVDEWTIEGSHFAERFQLFVIIALGESIVVTGATASAAGVDRATVIALTVCFLGSAALWWLYFDRIAGFAQARLARARDDESGLLGRDAYTYLHIPIIAGIVLSAVGDELVIAHPGQDGSLFAAFAIAGGPAVYLLGHLLFRARMARSTSRPRIAAVIVLAVLIVAGTELPLLGLAAVVVAVLAVLVAFETHDRIASERRAT
jgi:low temperature requirement protein LtrA